MTDDDPTETVWPRVVLALAVAVWLAAFSQLLVTSSLPRVPFVDNGRLSAAGHLFGSALLALQLVLLMPGRRKARAVIVGAAIAVAFVVGMEVVQELRPTRAYEAGDTVLDLVGTITGSAIGWAILRSSASAQRARMVVALMTIGVAAVGRLVIDAASVVDRVA